MTTPQFQNAWYNFSVAIANGLTALWNRITVLFQNATQVVVKAVEQNIIKAQIIIRQKRNVDYYWIAYSVTFRRKNVSIKTYFPCMPIPKLAAAAYVRTYGDVFASSQSSARRLAIIAGNSYTPVGPERHGNLGYFWHYHPYKRKGGHIFFM